MTAALVIGKAFDETLPGRRWMAVCRYCGQPVYGPTKDVTRARVAGHHANPRVAIQDPLLSGPA